MRRGVPLLAVAVVAALQVPTPNADGVAAMIERAENLAYFEGFAPARVILERAHARARLLGDQRLTALSLDRLGSALDFSGDLASGAKCHEEALTVARALHDRTSLASILASIGLTHWRQAAYDDALASLREALSIQEELGDTRGAARTHVFIGRVHFKTAAYDTAREHYLQALRLLEPHRDLRWRSVALEDLGDLALERGFFAEGLKYFEQSLEARRATGDVGGQVYMLTLLGRAYLQQGGYREALDWLDRAVSLSAPADARPSRALALYHLGIVRHGIGDDAKALELYAEALAIKEDLGDRRQQAWILGRMGDVHAGNGNHARALVAYGRATAIWEEIGDLRGTATGVSKAAASSLASGDYTRARTFFQRAADLYGVGQPAFTATALGGLARVHAAAGQETAAIEHARRAVHLARGGPDDVRWTALRDLGSIQRQFGHSRAAAESLGESLAVIESLRARVVPSPEVRAAFLEGKQAAYAEMVGLLVELGRGAEALEFAERARARAFLDLLAARGATGTIVARALTYRETQAEIRRRNVTAVEYFSTTDRLFVWVMPPDGRSHSRTTQISRQALDELVVNSRAVLAEGQDARAILRRLHDILIAPIADLLPADPNHLLTIVPHGPLFLVSFASLLDADNRYLVERHTLSYSPSLSVLRFTARNRDRVNGAAPRVLTVGNPIMPAARGSQPPFTQLPGAEKEVRAIGALYQHARALTLVGERAREHAVRDVAPEQTILHFATHAVLFDDDPRASYLALAADPPASGQRPPETADGFLTVDEVFGLDLRADLVTLSACNTGLGRISGEGVVGLSRAFIYAGAASVLVSLWPVADAVASVQMERFYEDVIATRGDKARALASAQRNIIRQLRERRLTSPAGRPLDEHPLFWAPFVLIGEPR